MVFLYVISSMGGGGSGESEVALVLQDDVASVNADEEEVRAEVARRVVLGGESVDGGRLVGVDATVFNRVDSDGGLLPIGVGGVVDEAIGVAVEGVVDVVNEGNTKLKRGVNKRLLLDDAEVSERHADWASVSSEVIFRRSAREDFGVLTMDEHTVSAIEVSVDLEAMESFLLSSDGVINLPIEEGKDAMVRVDRVVTRGEYTKTLIGSVEGEEGSDVLLVFHDGAVSGSIVFHDENLHYQFGAAGNGDVAVRRLDVHSFGCGCAGCSHGDNLVEDGAVLEALAELDDAEAGVDVFVDEDDGEILAAPAGYNPFDVVVAYSAEARQSDGGTANIEARIVQSVDRMNVAMTNSGSGVWYCSLLAIIEEPDSSFSDSDYSDMADMLVDLRQATNGVLDAVAELKVELGADHSTFVCNNPISGTAGIAGRPGTSLVVARSYMSSTQLGFCHEMGHSLGLRHAWGDTVSGSSQTDLQANPTNKSNYGWRFDPPNGEKVRTIMAYNLGWTSSKIPYFSNPDVYYNGVATGVVDGFDATDTSGTPTYDQQLVTDGAIGGLGAGYDGSNEDLGANNGGYLKNNAGLLANRTVRESLAVLEPAAGVNLEEGDEQTIFWYGGDHSDTVQVDLYKGGVFQFTIASGLSGEERWYDWTVPDVAYGDDYVVRVTLSGSSYDDGGEFTIGVAPAVLPYAESFENGRGVWRSSVDSDYDWTVNSGGTPTVAAGPSGASEGSFYLYSEGHDSGAPYSSSDVKAVFDFSGVGSAELTFDYHMYGLYIDYLTLDVYDGVSWDLDVWRQDGQAQSGSDDAWKSATVDLSEYAGNSGVTLRFTTKHKRWNSADPAIDNLVLDEIPLTAFEVWTAAEFTDSTEGADAGAMGDPDGDGMSNEMEYLLGTDPLVVDSAIISMSVGAGVMTFDYTRRMVDGYSIFAEWSGDLASDSWGVEGIVEVVTGDDGEVETVRGTVPVGEDEDRKFIRIRVEGE
ncbi:MAG: reprolysin-like metallopeptidase [Akkermansiaceae bacterium]